MARMIFIAGLVLLTGCATTTASPPASPSASAGCDAAPAQGSVGQTVPTESATALATGLLQQTGARTLRWIAPGMAVTMDFRPDRLSVSYDDKRTITQITCG